MTPHGQNQSPWTNSNQNRNAGPSNTYNLNDHLNTMRQLGGPSNGSIASPTAPKSISFVSGQGGSNHPTSTGTAGSVPLNSTRVVPTNKNKLIDSKLSSLRHEQDSTAASNNNQRFPMSADDAFKILGPYLWDIEKREIFEYKTIYFFPIEERKKAKNNGMNTNTSGA